MRPTKISIILCTFVTLFFFIIGCGEFRLSTMRKSFQSRSTAIEEKYSIYNESMCPGWEKGVDCRFPEKVIKKIFENTDIYLGNDAVNISLQFSPVSHYIDCINGNDENDGLKEITPWKTLKNAKTLQLFAGDNLFLKRGCEWRDNLWDPSGKFLIQGNSGNLAVIGAYGDQSLPKPILNGSDRICSDSEICTYQTTWEKIDCGQKVCFRTVDHNVKYDTSSLVFADDERLREYSQCENQPINSFCHDKNGIINIRIQNSDYNVDEIIIDSNYFTVKQCGSGIYCYISKESVNEPNLANYLKDTSKLIPFTPIESLPEVTFWRDKEKRINLRMKDGKDPSSLDIEITRNYNQNNALVFLNKNSRFGLFKDLKLIKAEESFGSWAYTKDTGEMPGAISFKNLDIEHIAWYGIYIGRAIESYKLAYGPIYIANNTLYDIGKGGIYVQAPPVKGNNKYLGETYGQDIGGLVIRGNKLTTVGWNNPSGNESVGIKCDYVNNVSIQGNTIEKAYSHAISLGASTESKISGNTLIKSGYWSRSPEFIDQYTFIEEKYKGELYKKVAVTVQADIMLITHSGGNIVAYNKIKESWNLSAIGTDGYANYNYIHHNSTSYSPSGIRFETYNNNNWIMFNTIFKSGRTKDNIWPTGNIGGISIVSHDKGDMQNNIVKYNVITDSKGGNLSNESEIKEEATTGHTWNIGYNINYCSDLYLTGDGDTCRLVRWLEPNESEFNLLLFPSNDDFNTAFSNDSFPNVAQSLIDFQDVFKKYPFFYENGTIAQDPFFTDAENGNFSLKSESPANNVYDSEWDLQVKLGVTGRYIK